MIDVPCGHHSLSGVASGPITIQATVTDASGSKSLNPRRHVCDARDLNDAAKSDLAARRRNAPCPPAAAHHAPGPGLLREIATSAGDCASWDESCDDRFHALGSPSAATYSAPPSGFGAGAGRNTGANWADESFEPGEADQQADLRYRPAREVQRVVRSTAWGWLANHRAPIGSPNRSVPKTAGCG